PDFVRTRSFVGPLSPLYPRDLCIPPGTTNPSPPRPESTRGQASLYSILLPRHRHCGCISQSLRWRVLDLRTGEAQAADLGYVVECTAVTGRGGLGQMAITQGRMPFVFGMVILATLLIAAPAAHAACRSPKNICKHLDDCLQRTSDLNNKDADGIRAGVKARNGQIVLAGAEACARDLGRKQQWDKWARGCSALEFVQIARVELELGKVYCDRYSQ